MLAWRYRRCAPRSSASPARSTSSVTRPVRHSRAHHGLRGVVPDAEIALVGYTLLILIWNTVAGPQRRPRRAREAATAMGYSRNAALLRVDLPLALPYIFAGLRVATATVIGLSRSPPSSAWAASASRSPTASPSVQHAHHRGPRLLGRPGRGLRPAHRRVQRLAVPWTRSSRRARVSDERLGPFPTLHGQRGRLVHHQCNWTGSSGIPYLFLRQASSRSPWCSVRWWWAAASASTRHTGRGAWWR